MERDGWASRVRLGILPSGHEFRCARARMCVCVCVYVHAPPSKTCPSLKAQSMVYTASSRLYASALRKFSKKTHS